MHLYKSKYEIFIKLFCDREFYFPRNVYKSYIVHRYKDTLDKEKNKYKRILYYIMLLFKYQLRNKYKKHRPSNSSLHWPTRV